MRKHGVDINRAKNTGEIPTMATWKNFTLLVYLADGECYIVVSYAGAPNSAPWFDNLVANPEVGVEVGNEHFSAHAEVAVEPERSKRYARVVETMPVFGECQCSTERVIPLVRLTGA
ncbi:MAG: nitroreductase/quinone reductase family protein [Pseudomonadales bacterium]|jgi:deazaflavin-dependent oxidoreductase (nitroreductase family)|nr:nitroreductase/quinone reductase family protein [Pseudomonadales bacterium]MDP6472388.1 nitroreductase/quinone reductase family protein [Pseudomonadales bacterium]MDP6828184.1 nitroreductase/quinone reductase family protein [Pseudomonadales bacterium]MDP6970262.1 nitroreductase/quinone reductase family protein [Pseudomonadales bacterium]|tara:strand:- start:2423 stop:2773 length:351 start_codon:yes stop_codon:yes gene_type:complete